MGGLLAFNRRRLHRNQMIKGAEILFGGTTLKAAVLDLSAAGAQVFLRSLGEVHEPVDAKRTDTYAGPALQIMQRAGWR